MTIYSTPYKEIFRSNYSSVPPLPPSYTAYTGGVSLTTAYILLIVILFVHLLTNGLLKLWLSKCFRAASLGRKIRHCVESLNISDIFEDWDETEEKLDIPEYRQRKNEVCREMTAALFIHWIFNVILLIPIMVTGNFMYPILYIC